MEPLAQPPYKRQRGASAPPRSYVEVVARNVVSDPRSESPCRPDIRLNLGNSTGTVAIDIPSASLPSMRVDGEVMLEEVRKERLLIASRISILRSQMDNLADVERLISQKLAPPARNLPVR